MTQFIHKRSLGQNFLQNEDVIARIVDVADINNDDVIVEIGPGQGALTELLAQKAQKVIAIELDDRLISVLKKRFVNADNVEIIHGDILNMSDIAVTHDLCFLQYKVVANIPYYITAPIIRLFLEMSISPQEIILMVQKEVAERLTAKPGQMSILAVSAQYYANVIYLFDVPKEDFEPVPKVDSAVIKLKVKSKKSKADKEFFHTVKIGFSARRKTLANNLANGFQRNKKEIEDILKEMGFKTNVRAQELSVDEWKTLSHKMIW